MRPVSASNSKPPDRVTYGKYQSSRFWAIWIDDELLVVTVYRKGARAVLKAFGLERAAVELKQPKLPDRRAW